MSTDDRPGWSRESDDNPSSSGGSDDRPSWRPPPDERPWRPEAAPASASGGHLPPDPTASSTYDPLGGPLPSEVATRQGGVDPNEPLPRTDVVPRARPEAGRPSPGPRRRPGMRRLKRTVRHIDPMSVLKLSLFFYATFLILWLVIVAIVYSVLESMGLFNSIEELSRAFVLDWDSNISLFFVERWALLIGLTIGILGSLLNVFLAFLYNVAADMVGGVEMTFAEREY